MDGDAVSEANEQTDGPETPKRTSHLDDEQGQSTPSIVNSPCIHALDGDEEFGEGDVVKSTPDEFASVQCIPETPPRSNWAALETVARKEEEGENSDASRRVVAGKHRRTKRKRVEPILSSEEDEPTTEGIRNYPNVQDTDARQNASPRRQQTDQTRLKPLPRGAPRIIEKKGRYTIHKGIRIRDYKIPSPDSPSYLPPPSSPEFQCRDGFDANEASLGYPQPMNPRAREIGDPAAASPDSNHIMPGTEGNQLSRSPSLGTAR